MNRKKQVLVTSIFVILLSVFLPFNTMAAKSKIIPNDESGIPDKVLYQTILREVGKNKSFTEKDAEKIKQLDASKDKIKNKIKTLKGIGKLKNLTKLDVSSNNIKSLSGIENLFNLTSLYADHNQIKNIDPIKNLYNLRYVSLNYNKISSLKSIEKLTQLESLDVQVNKIKKIPDLNRYTNLSEIGLKYNKISEEELNKKLPRYWRRNSTWYKSTVNLQKLVKTITLVKPTSFRAINKNTKNISGITNKNSTISLRDPKGKKIVSVKTDSKGKFTFRNLNLKKWAGKTLALQSYVVDQLYGEKNILKEVKFTVH
ncbi:leucine-rich repeat domain-containing protein [Robinsoniella sp. RHS]|uniref:leucine-rich repeat domain-containing protein n=1 Tax=Robinsoniella sp. RHS TaxID=1504536 RepID=UPI00064B0CFB